MGKKKTPILLNLRTSGGTLYVFPSAYEDVGLNLLSTTTGVAMSHYALLNLPSSTKFGSNDNPNEAVALSLLNYLMNFETLLINLDNYNYQELLTVSERVFWQWVNKYFGISLSGLENGIYYELNNNNVGNNIVKCIGKIDAGNTLSTEFGMYNETYINVPTSYGQAICFFEVLQDNNMKLQNYKSENTTNTLEGRDDTTGYYSYHIGKDIPVYDDGTQYNTKYDNTGKLGCLSLVKNLKDYQYCLEKYSKDVIHKEFNVSADILLTSFDDINIDIDKKFDTKDEFEFNTILLYYSVYDQDDLVKTAYTTNLFGVIFLDGAYKNESTSSIYIPSLTKKKSSADHFGNSYSFRVNIKTQSVYDNTNAEILDNTTMSSILSVELSDVISNLNQSIDTLNSNTQTINKIQDQYASIISRYDDLQDDIQDLLKTVDLFINGTLSKKIEVQSLYTDSIKGKDGKLDICTDSLLNPILEIKEAEVNIKDDNFCIVDNYNIDSSLKKSDPNIWDLFNDSGIGQGEFKQLKFKKFVEFVIELYRLNT